MAWPARLLPALEGHNGSLEMLWVHAGLAASWQLVCTGSVTLPTTGPVSLPGQLHPCKYHAFTELRSVNFRFKQEN